MRMPSPPDPAVASAGDARSDLAREALRVSESRYRRLFETARDGILLLNIDTAQIEDVNPYLIEMLGYSHAEFLGKKLWEVGPFADRAESKEMFAELQTKGYVRYDDLPLKTITGTLLAVEFVSNTYDCEGVKVIQCNIRNIAERKAAEAKIRRHTLLYAALSQCNKAIVHCTTKEELFPQICHAAVQFGGMKMAWVGLIDAETLMVRPVASFGGGIEHLRGIEISVDADSPFGRSPTGTCIRENRPFWCQDFVNDPLTVPWRERGAHAGWAAVASLPLHSNGNIIGAFVLCAGETNAFDEAARDLLVEMATDIGFALDNFTRESQRKVAEVELVRLNAELEARVAARTQELERANRELEAFSYSVAHDLRSPLRAMLGFSDILVDANREKLDPNSIDHLRHIQAGARRMAHLIDDLLELSRVSRQEMHRLDFDASGLAEQSAKSLVEVHPRRKVQLTVQPGMVANGDPRLVRIALDNLLGNAWKFTARTAEARIEVGQHERDGETVFFVRDNGAGFDMLYADKLFGSFQRLHGQDEFEGTGIGLSIVQRIVVRHGGRVWAEGKVGQGATFYFTLGTAH